MNKFVLLTLCALLSQFSVNAKEYAGGWELLYPYQYHNKQIQLVGVESGYFYGDAYAELIKNPKFFSNISEVIDIEDNIKLLMSGHLDGFLADPYTVEAFIEKYKMEGEFEKHPVEIYSDDIYIILSKQSTDPALLKQINTAISQLSEQGKLGQTSNSRFSAIEKCNAAS